MMNLLIKYSLVFLFCLTGSMLWPESAIGGKPPKIDVQAVIPESASQGETHYGVIIRGVGFDKGSTVRFLVAGTNDDTQVEITGEIDFVNGDLVVPTLHVLDDATVDLYDVEVQTSSGRRGKGTDRFRVEQKEGGNQNPTYDVTFDGNLEDSYGLMWQSDSQQNSITYFASDPQFGSGVMDLSYFRLGFGDDGPFNGTQGNNCFDQKTLINAVQFFPDKNGDAILKGSFIGYSHSLDPAITTRTFMYLFTFTGQFDDSSNWLPQPQDPTTVTITGWKLKLKSKREDNLYSDITCTGAGTIAATIGVFRND